jgi:hypothetical protein
MAVASPHHEAKAVCVCVCVCVFSRAHTQSMLTMHAPPRTLPHSDEVGFDPMRAARTFEMRQLRRSSAGIATAFGQSTKRRAVSLQFEDICMQVTNAKTKVCCNPRRHDGLGAHDVAHLPSLARTHTPHTLSTTATSPSYLPCLSTPNASPSSPSYLYR